MQGDFVMEDFGDIPIGLTGFDEWMMKLFCIMVVGKFLVIDMDSLQSLDRDHWRNYYNLGYTPEEAFEEDLTAYGD